MRRVLLLCLMVVSTDLVASEDYASGKQLAESFKIDPPTNAQEVPNYGGENVPEAHHLESPGSLESQAAAQLQSSSEGVVLQEGAKTRQEFHEVFDEAHPLIQESSAVVEDPLKILGGEIESNGSRVVKHLETEHVCEEAGEPEELSCEKSFTFSQRFFTNKRYGYTTIQGSSFRRYYINGNPQYTNPYTRRLGHDHAYNMRVVDEALPEVSWRYFDGCNWYSHSVYRTYHSFEDFELIEEPRDGCEALEAYVDQNKCAYKSTACVEGPETRMIFGRPVYRECWKTRQTYACRVDSPNTCGALRAKGCLQTHVACKRRVGEVCVEYTKTFKCGSQHVEGEGLRIKGDIPFCLDGNCDTHGWEPNQDLGLALSKLSIFREMAKEMDKLDPPTVFRGQGRKCSRTTLNFQDCCGGGGWGENLKLSTQCSAEELQLQQDKPKCTYVGSYCAERDPILKICLKKNFSYCCFGSKIAKLFQEQGRRQLGVDWGSAEHPDCRPLTLDEIQRIDFSQIDLSSLFEEMRPRLNTETLVSTTQGLTQNWSAKVGSLEKVAKKEEVPQDEHL